MRATVGMKATAAKASYFAANATEMARSVGILSTIAPHFHTQASQALSALQTIANPAEKEAAEKAYLATFHGFYSAALSQAVPVIRNLMMDNSHGVGGGSATIGSDSTGAPSAPTTNALSPAGMGTQAASTATLPVTGGGVGTPTAPAPGMPPHQLQHCLLLVVGWVHQQHRHRVCHRSRGYPQVQVRVVPVCLHMRRCLVDSPQGQSVVEVVSVVGHRSRGYPQVQVRVVPVCLHMRRCLVDSPQGQSVVEVVSVVGVFPLPVDSDPDQGQVLVWVVVVVTPVPVWGPV